jgi:hypothetical protein
MVPIAQLSWEENLAVADQPGAMEVKKEPPSMVVRIQVEMTKNLEAF